MSTPQAAVREGSRLLLVLVLVALASLHRFWNGQVWDDENLFELTRTLSAHGRMLAVFTHSTLGLVLDHPSDVAEVDLDLYRPLALFSLALNQWLGGESLFGYHATNLALHLGCVTLVFAIARELLREDRKGYALLAAACFGVTPQLAEAHVWISGRFDEVCTIFGLVSLLSFVKARAASERGSRVAWSGASALSFLLGLLGKEALVFALPAFAFIPSTAGVQPRPTLRARALSIAPLALATGIYFGLRAQALHGSGSGIHSLREALYSLAHLPLVICDAVVSLLLPVNVYSRMLIEDYAPLGVLGLAAGAVVCVLLGVLAYRMRAAAPVFTWSLFWLACTVVPITLIATRSWPGFGRFLYLPATMFFVGMADLVACTLEHRPRFAILGRPLAAAYVAVLALALVVYTADYESDDTLFGSIVEHAPAQSHGYGFLGITYVGLRKYPEAIVLLQKADALWPHERRYMRSLGKALLFGGRPDDARKLADRAIAHFPRAPEFHLLRAYTLLQSDPEAATRDVFACLQQDLENRECREALGFLVGKHPNAALFRTQFRALAEARAQSAEAKHRALARFVLSKL